MVDTSPQMIIPKLGYFMRGESNMMNTKAGRLIIR